MLKPTLTRRQALAGLSGLGCASPFLARAAEPALAAAHWTPPLREALRSALSTAPRHGLDPKSYLVAIESASDADLTRTALAYARVLAYGAVDPHAVHAIYTLERPNAALASDLAVALRSGRLTDWLSSLAPDDADYQALSDAYVEQSRIAARSPALPDVPAGRSIRPGAEDARIPAIIRRLEEHGLGVQADDRRYGPELAAAVLAFQRKSGLEDDGIVGPATLDELNQGPRDRVRQLAVNLERRRWLARRPPATRIDVNVADARLVYLKDGAPAWRGRVVVGAPGHETPWMGESFNRLVVNPPWRVPSSIARREILPRGPAYLRAHRMRVVNGRVIQSPGPSSALGRVKFDMRNRYAIYLHDTPAKALFGAAERHRSHGCVRVEDAEGFARHLAGERGASEAIEAAFAGRRTATVLLDTAVPVRLLYLTAVPEADGRIRFVADPYGWDDRLATRMGLVPGRLRASLPPRPDLAGP